MTGRSLAPLGDALTDMLDGLADSQVILLRRRAGDMADALDRGAQRDVEGAREWRHLQNTGNRYATR